MSAAYLEGLAKQANFIEAVTHVAHEAVHLSDIRKVNILLASPNATQEEKQWAIGCMAAAMTSAAKAFPDYGADRTYYSTHNEISAYFEAIVQWPHCYRGLGILSQILLGIGK